MKLLIVKLLIGIGILVIGSTVAAVIDILLGISFSEVNSVAHGIHKLTYMLLGGIILLYIMRNKW